MTTELQILTLLIKVEVCQVEAAEAGENIRVPLGIVNHELLNFFLVHVIQLALIHATQQFKERGLLLTHYRAFLAHPARMNAIHYSAFADHTLERGALGSQFKLIPEQLRLVG